MIQYFREIIYLLGDDRIKLPILVIIFIVALVLGITMTLPIGGADMPVVISLYNALTGLAVGFEGYVSIYTAFTSRKWEF